MGDIDEALNAEFYRPFDQDRWLPPPWSPDLIPLVNWEKAHGHDVRLACVSGRCRAVEYEADVLRSELARLRSVVAGVEALADEMLHTALTSKDHRSKCDDYNSVRVRLRSVLSDTKGEAQ